MKRDNSEDIRRSNLLKYKEKSNIDNLNRVKKKAYINLRSDCEKPLNVKTELIRTLQSIGKVI
jgi:hypothetical protein